MPADALVSMNIWGFTPAVYDDLAVEFPRFLEANKANIEKAEFYIPNFVTDLIRTGRARCQGPADAREVARRDLRGRQAAGQGGAAGARRRRGVPGEAVGLRSLETPIREYVDVRKAFDGR